jgi:hypothetical protein
MRTALQLRGLIRNTEEKLRLYELMREVLTPEQLVDQGNFHARCVLARQQLAMFRAEQTALLSPAASAASSHEGLAGSLVTATEFAYWPGKPL